MSHIVIHFHDVIVADADVAAAAELHARLRVAARQVVARAPHLRERARHQSGEYL